GAVSAAQARLAAHRSTLAEERLERGASALMLLEERLERLAAGIAEVAEPAQQQHDALAAATIRLDAAFRDIAKVTDNTQSAIGQLAGAIPAAMAQSETLIALLGRSENLLKGQLAETENLLAGLHIGASEAEASSRATVTAIADGVEAIAAASSRAQDGLVQPLAALKDTVDSTFTRTTQAVDTTRSAVHAQTNAMLASVEQARVTLDHIAGEASKALREQLEMLMGMTGKLAADLDGEAGRTQAFVDDITRTFGVLDVRLGNAATTSTNTLEGISARVADAKAALDGLDEPIAGAENAMGVLEARLAEMDGAARNTLGTLIAGLPDMLPGLDDIGSRLADLTQSAIGLSGPVGEGAQAMADAQNRFDQSREAMIAAQAELNAALERASTVMNDIETSTGSVSLAASSELVDTFARVREIAQATAGTMRETLAGVVAEAEDALSQAGTRRANAAFGAPIRAELAELAEAQEQAATTAQSVTERIAQRLLILTQTVSEMESHIDAVETRSQVRGRNSLGKRANSLIASLQSSAVDMAKLLDFDIDDKIWDDFAAGDRSAIARRLARGLDQGAERSFASHYQHDQEFRTEAARYITEFEALVSDTVPERGGQALGAALLGSTLGKLYLALAQAAGRLN
ncbi:hypothetical protein, partial [Sandarakinorhabdus sp.]|uniref:hypothetical protein n=1 Tax=Sandarakinorhabdus sp. TaxID=1916663 RepID=UPI00286DF621